MREWRGHEAIVASWRERHRLLQALHLELKPTTRDEQHGLYPERLFPIYPLMRSFQNIDAHHPWVPIDEYLRGGRGRGPNQQQVANNATASQGVAVGQMLPEAASKVIGEAGLTGVSLSVATTTAGPPPHGGTAAGLASSSSMASPAPLPSLHLSMPVEGGEGNGDGDGDGDALGGGEGGEGGGGGAVDDDDHTVSTTTSQSEFSLQSGSVHTENTSVGGQRRRMSRLKAAGDAIMHAIRCEDGLGEALTVIRGREKRTVGLIQLACEKEKAKIRRARRHELREQKRHQLYPLGHPLAAGASSGTASPAMLAFGTSAANSRPRTGGGDGSSLEGGGPPPVPHKSIEPFEGQNMVAWAVMKVT